MKVKTKTSYRGMLAVHLPNCVIVPNNIPRYTKTYPTISISSSGASLTTGTLGYWSEQEGAVPVFEGDTLEVTF